MVYSKKVLNKQAQIKVLRYWNAIDGLAPLYIFREDRID